MTLRNFNLAPDPLHYAGYEWGLESLVAALAKELRQGRYSPERGEVVRSAKGTGLSRPLCFLATRDALVYRAITWLASEQLMSHARSWVGVARSDKGRIPGPPDVRIGDSFDWFTFWLARQGKVADMVDDPDVNYFVESDIANFYPSIRLEAVREHLHSQTNLEKEVVRLCVQIVDGVMPRQDYSEVSLMGLPQEQVGSSREIAHSLLVHVDDEFEREGSRGRYTRYMDDILIGVATLEEGESCVSRLQRRLESLGLYPNAAKTNVTKVGDYLHGAMVLENGEIDRLDQMLEVGNGGKPYVFEAPGHIRQEIADFSAAHRFLKDRPRRWSRVTRRIYTLHRKAGVEVWRSHWRADIDADPGAASTILEYVRAWPLDDASMSDLLLLSAKYGDLYPDVSLLAAEVISSAPVCDDSAFWSKIYMMCQAEFERFVLKSQVPERERLAAAWLMAGWKFGNPAQRRNLLSRIPSTLDATSPTRVQALSLLAAGGDTLSDWVAAKPGLAWENALAAEYLRSLQEGEGRAVGVALSLIEPSLRLLPQRYVILPRAVPLIEVLGRSAHDRLGAVAPRMLKRLQRNQHRLRDFRMEAILAQWCL